MLRIVAEGISFETDPSQYRHWRLEADGPVATLTLAVDPERRPSRRLRAQAELLRPRASTSSCTTRSQRLRFEHPQVKAVVITGGLDKVFSAGANIQMLASSTHAHKVAFCKFTNETRNGIEEMSSDGGQVVIAAVNGTAAGGGYELALRVRRDPARRRQVVGRLAPRGAAARGAARYRWPDASRRQAPRPPRPRRRVRDEGRKGSRAAGASSGASSTRWLPPSSFAELVRERALGACGRVRPAG